MPEQPRVGHWQLHDLQAIQRPVHAHVGNDGGIENGDAEAEKIWLKSVRDLATAICSFSNILDPEAVIIGGGISKAGDRLFVPLREYVAPLLWKTDDYELKLLPAHLGDLAGAYGAAANSMGV